VIQNTFPSPAAKDSDVECPTVGRNPAWVPPNCDRMYLGIHLGLYRALTTFHLYGPKFTSFKNGAPREGAAANAAGERAMFSLLEGLKADMRELAVNIFGDVGIATFNGHFTGMMNGSRPISGSRRPWYSSARAMNGNSCTSTSRRWQRRSRIELSNHTGPQSWRPRSFGAGSTGTAPGAQRREAPARP
jgi:hypothetical protein